MISAWKAKRGAEAQFCAFFGQERGVGGTRTGAEGPVIPRWLSVLHRFVTVAVFVAICLATVALVVALVHVGRSCYERTAHTARSLTTSLPGIQSTLDELP